MLSLVSEFVLMSTDKPPFQIAIIPVTPFQQNASIIWETATQRAAIVDPGGDVPQLLEAVKQLGVKPESILLTHGHIDHAGGAAELAKVLGVPVIGPHIADLFLLEGLPGKGREYGLDNAQAVVPDRWLVEGDTVSIGDVVFDVLHVPGHTPGHIVFVHKGIGVALVGDTLFAGSVGRTDFAYGDGELLITGIKEKLLPLGDAMAILPGHGATSTIGRERMGNPFLQS
jgi:hydroxyacylglutathione hydrolase